VAEKVVNQEVMRAVLVVLVVEVYHPLDMVLEIHQQLHSLKVIMVDLVIPAAVHGLNMVEVVAALVLLAVALLVQVVMVRQVLIQVQQ
jgi:hypothetical protein